MSRFVIQCSMFVIPTVLALPATPMTALAQPYSIDWHTIDGGGIMNSAGGVFTLSGAIGQSDAGPAGGEMTGGTFSLAGGFWSVSLSCECLGDMTGDGLRDGRDIQKFVNCVIAGGHCVCADMDGLSGINSEDIGAFVADLIGGVSCP